MSELIMTRVACLTIIKNFVATLNKICCLAEVIFQGEASLQILYLKIICSVMFQNRLCNFHIITEIFIFYI